MVLILSTYSGVFIVLIGKIQSRFPTLKRIERGQCSGVRCLGISVVIEAIGLAGICTMPWILRYTSVSHNAQEPIYIVIHNFSSVTIRHIYFSNI